MELENELQRVLRDDKLDVPVRTGAEWSLVAGARRRRRHRNTAAAVGGVLTALSVVGGSVVVVGGESQEDVPPAVRPVVTVTSKSVEQPAESEPVVPHEPHRPSPRAPGRPEPDPSAQRESSGERASVLRESETSEPLPTTSEPAPTTSPTQTSPAAPSSSVVEEQPPD